MPAESVVYVVDDEPAMRASLALLLASAGLEASVHESGPCLLSALDTAPAPVRRCLVTDLHMPGMGGLELQERLSASPHAMPVVVITGQGDVPAAVRALKAGAVDFIEKPFPPELLLERVGEALERDRRLRADSERVRAACKRMETLTARETEVMHRLLDGCANKVVAIELGISERTVEQHRARVMRKLAVRSVAELVELAIRAGRRRSS